MATTTTTTQERARTLLLKIRVAKMWGFVVFFGRAILKSFRNRWALKDFGVRARRRARLHFVKFFAEDSRDGTRARAFDRFRHARARSPFGSII